ncbi:hypothetical protein GP486_004364 [Trichoglossum hirsutum]|uniref:Voltage-gated hydrogen channel 1 n=1 Tax=Trichoglossum hirsutum TaxID=265104 RepID=A0A9P8RP93_9PEZI|nr:hypothetical protein GP486_004364 [Trichoglossum hirsutum]
MNDETEPLIQTGGIQYGNLIAPPSPESGSRVRRARLATKRFLASKVAHYSILLMVTLDVTCIFGDIFINLFTCGKQNPDRAWGVALEVLGDISSVFSCLFLLELLVSVWAAGYEYFQSWFHCFDAGVIIVGFVVDVLLHGVVEEVVSLVVVLRLWRIFKIVEEFSVGAEEEMHDLRERVEQLEDENKKLKEELIAVRREHGSLYHG